LPVGAFVFEFLGEIMTTKQMEQRNDEYRARKAGSFPDYVIALDVPSVLDDSVTDEEILYIDATNCGNITRFVNHHCGDANLIYFNVHIERRSTQLYHVSPLGIYHFHWFRV
jgi:SET domain-containing protein